MKLGMQLREGAIDQVYEETLKPYLQDSVLLDAPYPHIESTLKDGTKITLEFSSAARDRRLFAIHWNHGFSPPQEVKALRQSLEQRYGKPAWESTDPGAAVLGFPSTGRRDVKLSPAQLREFLFFGFQQWVAILGVDFKGTVVTVVTHRGSVVRVVTEKLDYPLATTVFAAVDAIAAPDGRYWKFGSSYGRRYQTQTDISQGSGGCDCHQPVPGPGRQRPD